LPKEGAGRLSGKIALITGAAQGLGAATAERFAQEGAEVWIADILDAQGAALAQTMAAQDLPARYCHLDVTNDMQWQAALDTIESECGGLDILINNAAVAVPFVPVEERTAGEWDRVMAVNAKGTFLGTKYVIPRMRRRGGGAIVNISSAAGIGQCQIMEAAYAASKGAVRIFTKIVAAQHAKDGIRCNSVHPGPIDSELARAILSGEDVLRRRLSRVPMGRLAGMAEVVSAVLYLASDEASYTTGAELAVDGGALVQ
jgi:cyclopentanol dehydrogenase